MLTRFYLQKGHPKSGSSISFRGLMALAAAALVLVGLGSVALHDPPGTPSPHATRLPVGQHLGIQRPKPSVNAKPSTRRPYEIQFLVNLFVQNGIVGTVTSAQATYIIGGDPPTSWNVLEDGQILNVKTLRSTRQVFASQGQRLVLSASIGGLGSRILYSLSCIVNLILPDGTPNYLDSDIESRHSSCRVETVARAA